MSGTGGLSGGFVGAARTVAGEEGAEVAVKGGEEAVDGFDVGLGDERGQGSKGRMLVGCIWGEGFGGERSGGGQGIRRSRGI